MKRIERSQSNSGSVPASYNNTYVTTAEIQLLYSDSEVASSKKRSPYEDRYYGKGQSLSEDESITTHREQYRMPRRLLAPPPLMETAHSPPPPSLSPTSSTSRKNLTLNLKQGRTSPGSTIVTSPGSSSVSAHAPQWRMVKTPRRGCRMCETESVSSSVAPILPGHHSYIGRETVTSRLRMERNHHRHDGCLHTDEVTKAYMSPAQRKTLSVQKLKNQVQQLTVHLEEQERELQNLRESVVVEKEELINQLQKELQETQALAESAREEATSLQVSHEESVKTVATLQQELEDAKKETVSKMANLEETFLDMYNKGRKSAIFEREEELELQGKDSKTSATEAELRSKLERTQAELARWQTLQRHESYHDTYRPETAAEATLRFLKDSVFHFLTAEKKRGEEHLRAIIRIMGFSEIQRQKITHALNNKRKNKTTF